MYVRGVIMYCCLPTRAYSGPLVWTSVLLVRHGHLALAQRFLPSRPWPIDGQDGVAHLQGYHTQPSPACCLCKILLMCFEARGDVKPLIPRSGILDSWAA